MNIKANLSKFSMGVGLAAILATAYAFDPTKQVVITNPLVLDEVSEDSAKLYTADDQYTVVVDFNARTFNDGDGFQTWSDVEIEEITNIEVHDDHGPVEFYMDSEEVIDMKVQIQSELYKKLSGG